MSQAPESSKTVHSNKATKWDGTGNDSQISTGGNINPNKISGSDKLSYDWGKTLQRAKAFRIPDSDLANSIDDEISSDKFLVPEPPSLSGIIDSTISCSSSKTSTDVEEKYVDDDMSSLSSISEIEVSSGPRKHEYGKERIERVGNVYDKLYNACLKGQLNTIKDILDNHDTHWVRLMQDEQGQTPLYAACIGNQTEVVSILTDNEYDVNHQDNEGKTPLHVAFENHAPDLANILITKFKANVEILDKQNWTPLHTAIDRGYSSYSQQLSQNFLCEDVGAEVSWIQLHVACIDENTQHVKFLLDANIDVNHASSAGQTPLHIAVDKSNIDIVTLLLDENVNVSSITIDRKTPLHIAVDKGEEAIIQKLLASEADPNMKDAFGNTCLHCAIPLKQVTKPWLLKAEASVEKVERCPLPTPYQSCSIQTVQAIIKHGANVNAVNNRNQTALWLACSDGREDVVKCLLDTGADPTITDTNGDSSLHSAIDGRCSTVILQQIIVHGAQVNAANKDGATPLLLACSTVQTQSVRLLLKAKADPNIADADGDTSLHEAVAANCSEGLLQEIIGCGAEVNAVNKKGISALLLGCFHGYTDSVEVLLSAGADPTILDEVDYSCLFAAVEGRCSINTLQALIDHGAHIDVKRKDGTNALLCACRTGQSESVRFLLEAGADVNISTPDGNTCLHVAVRGHCSKDALQQIIQHGVSVNAVNKRSETALILASRSAQVQTVNILLENGADPNISDGRDWTSLHTAVNGRCTNETLREIIAHKAHLDAQNINGETALVLACFYQQQDSIKMLLEAGSNPNIASTTGCTSLHLAVFSACSKTIIRAIIDRGADVNAANEDKVTALMIAAHKDNIDAINMLLKAGADPNIADANGCTCLSYAFDRHCSEEAHKKVSSHGAYANADSEDKIIELMVASKKRRLDAINVLLNGGADLNNTNVKGKTCLMYAIDRDCSEEALQTMVDHGADVNVVDKDSMTALMIACWKGNTDAINMLLKAGSNPSIVNANRDSCLNIAADRSLSKDLLQALIDHGAEVNTTNNQNLTALMIACWKGNFDAINLLLNAGADPNIALAKNDACFTESIDHDAGVNEANKSGVTALWIACHQGDADTINVLLTAGADPNIAHINGDTCLKHAIDIDCSKDVLHTIIAHGADVNATNKQNVTALLSVCRRRNQEFMYILLNAGADPNIADVDGYTCLHFAVQGRYCKEVIQALIDHGAKVNAANKQSLTALMIACWEGYTYAISLLLDAGADPNIALANESDFFDTFILSKSTEQYRLNAADKSGVTALMLLMTCHKGYVDAIYELLNAGANPNIISTKGNTCLHHAVYRMCCKEVLQTLIHHGTDVNVANKSGVTALLIACHQGNADAINVLLNAGANPNIVSTEGNTCLHHAVCVKCCKEVLKVLIDHGANVNATNSDQETALLMACWQGTLDSIVILLNAGADPNIADKNGNTCLIYATDHLRVNKVTQTFEDLDELFLILFALPEPLLGWSPQITQIKPQVLLNEGANPNNASTAENIRHHFTVYGRYWNEELQALIDYDAEVNATNDIIKTSRLTSYMESVGMHLNLRDYILEQDYVYLQEADCKEILLNLINHGADVNAINSQHQSALMVACCKGNVNVINTLLDASADSTSADANGDTCLHYAVRGSYSEEPLCTLITHGADINATNKYNQTALALACLWRNTVAVNVLLTSRADPSIDDKMGNTLLHNAVHRNINTKRVLAIINLDAKVNALNSKGSTTLLLAEQSEAVYLLLTAGADTSIDDVNEVTTSCHKLFHRECDQDMLQMLLDHGVNVNARNNRNQTAYMLAFEQENIDAQHSLVQAGADPDITLDSARDNDSDNDSYLSLHLGNIDAQCASVHAGADSDITIDDSDSSFHPGKVNAQCARVHAGADPGITSDSARDNDSDSDSDSSLHPGDIDALCARVHAGADPDVTLDSARDNDSDSDSDSSLHPGKVDAKCALVHAGADPGITLDSVRDNDSDSDSDSSLHPGKVDAQCALVHAGADPGITLDSARDNDSDSDSDSSLHPGKVDAQCALVHAGADPGITLDSARDSDSDSDSSLHNSDDECPSCHRTLCCVIV